MSHNVMFLVTFGTAFLISFALGREDVCGRFGDNEKKDKNVIMATVGFWTLFPLRICLLASRSNCVLVGADLNNPSWFGIW